jgi:hypothetical protein
MKIRIAIISLFIIALTSCKSTKFATDCSKLKLDLKKGTLNNVKPDASPEKVKNAFTCFTGETEEGSSFNCGGGIFYLDHDFFFYTHRNYIEVRENFNNDNIEPAIMGKSMKEIEEMYGQPALKPEVNIYLYEMPYGTLQIEFYDGFVNMIAIHSDKPDEVELCF